MEAASADADAGATSSDVGCTATSCAGEDLPPGGAPLPVTPIIDVAEPRIVLVKRPYTSPKRIPVILRVDDGAFDGSGMLNIAPTDQINFFDAATNGNPVADGATFSGGKLVSGVSVFAEGANPSTSIDQVVLTLTLTKGSKAVKPPASAKLTSVRVTLDICMSRTSKSSDPALLSQADKINVGRFLQVQDSNLCGRAMLIIRKAEPESFGGKLVLTPIAGKNNVQAFAATDEIPSGQAPLANRHIIDNSTIDKTAGEKRWAETITAPSTALRDTGFQLGVDGVDDDGDRVAITAVKFTEVKATIKSTPPNTNRVAQGFALPVDHVYKNTSVSPDFTVNTPLVLFRNAQPDITLEVNSSPPGLPVLWQALRNEKDNATLGSATDLPTVTPDGGNPLKASLNANQKGSFRVRAFLDCNASTKYDDKIDLEPSIPLHLVLANATVVADNSASNSGTNLSATVAGSTIRITNGLWPTGATVSSTDLGKAGMGMELIADVTGGGDDCLLGLDMAFAGLVNMVQTRDVVSTYIDTTVTPAATIHLRFVAALNASAATGSNGGTPMFQPGDPAVTLFTLPLLDSGRSPGVGTGGETATMSRSGPHTSVSKVVSGKTLGQTWTIRCVDSPGMSFPFRHPANANAALQSIHYHYLFTACFCFWTNTTKSRGATGDPADRTYSVLRIVNWEVVGDWTVTFPAGTPAPPPNLTVTTPHKITVPSRNTINPIGRAQDNAVEVRPPSGIQIAVWDGSS